MTPGRRAAGVLVGLLTASPGVAAPLVVRGTVLAGRDLEPISDGAVLVEDGRIVAVGPAATVVVPAGAEIVEAGDRFVVPALIDNHVHVLDRLGGRSEELAHWLAAGVGTLVDCGSSIEGLRAAARTDTGGGPRILGSGPILTAPGGYPLLGSVGMPGLEIADAAEAGHEARLLLAAGADLLKVAIETGFDRDLGGTGAENRPTRDWPTLAESTVAAVVAEAHAAGRTVRAHVTQSGELARAFDAGVDAAAHTPTDPIPEALLAAAVQHGRILITTAALWREMPELQAIVLENLRRWVAAGGRIALGTDAPTFHPGWAGPRLEIETLQAGGLAAEAIVSSATVWGGAAVGLEGELGSLEPGARADLIVLPRDPRADATALLESEVVVARGRVVRSFGGSEP
ncbi:MAG: amidohydrolase family protein [Thermoanaerobaculia bacterium]